MYNPPYFEVDQLSEIHEAIRAIRLANFVTATTDGLIASPLPLFLDASEGEFGVLYGHLARANGQWKATVQGEALAIFMGPDAYISPAWYAAKAETGKVVPTWNYLTIQAYGQPEFFEDRGRLLEVVSKLTNIQEAMRTEPWHVTDAPEDFIDGQLRGIIGLRLPITRLEGKSKMSQNRSQADRIGVADGLKQGGSPSEQRVAKLIPT